MLTGGPGDGHGDTLPCTIGSNTVSISGHSEPANGARILWSGYGLSEGTRGRRLETTHVQSERLRNTDYMSFILQPTPDDPCRYMVG